MLLLHFSFTNLSGYFKNIVEKKLSLVNDIFFSTQSELR